jgi:hypothetical protein
MVGPAVRERVARRKSSLRAWCDVLFQVIGMYENSASVARVMVMMATAPLKAVADNVRADELASADRWLERCMQCRTRCKTRIGKHEGPKCD